MSTKTDLAEKLKQKNAEKAKTDKPTPKPGAEKKAPAATKEKTPVSKKPANKEADNKKTRRGPIQMLQHLEDTKARWEKEHQERIERITGKIDKLKAENESKVEALEALKSGETVESIDKRIKELMNLKRNAKKVAASVTIVPSAPVTPSEAVAAVEA